jgi:RNA polymerase sigma-70 factor (ECF subfamily)
MSMARNTEQKFISIYKTYVDEVYQYIFLRTGFDVSLAEDLTQDIFLEVYRSLNGFRGLCSERTWVFKIAKNCLFDFYRRQYNQHPDTIPIDNQLVEQISDVKQDLEEYLQTNYENQRVRECLSLLPQQYKIVLLLKYIEEKRVKEIAQILDRSPKSVESMLQRARGAFIELYRKEEL